MLEQWFILPAEERLRTVCHEVAEGKSYQVKADEGPKDSFVLETEALDHRDEHNEARLKEKVCEDER